MYSPHDPYSPQQVLRHVDDPDLFVEEFQSARRQEDEARARFVDGLTPEVKAEWIDGEAVFHPPARHAHNAAVHALVMLLSNYSVRDDGYYVLFEKAMMKAVKDLYEPDVAVWNKSKHSFEGQLLLYPPSDLVIEVLSDSTASIDRGAKFLNYAKAGIAEYWIVDADKERLEQYFEVGGAYEIQSILGLGDTVTSRAVEGFTIPVAAIFEQAAFAKAVVELVAS